MLWAIAAMAMVFLLGTAVFGTMPLVLQREADMEIHVDEMFLAQDIMEREKYNARFSKEEASLPHQVDRNGRTYTIEMQQVPREMEGVAMVEMICRVTHSSGRTVELVQCWEAL